MRVLIVVENEGLRAFREFKDVTECICKKEDLDEPFKSEYVLLIPVSENITHREFITGYLKEVKL